MEHQVNPVTGNCVMCGRNAFNRKHTPQCDYKAKSTDMFGNDLRKTDSFGTPRQSCHDQSIAALRLVQEAMKLLRPQCTPGGDVADVLDSFIPAVNNALLRHSQVKHV